MKEYRTNTGTWLKNETQPVRFSAERQDDSEPGPLRPESSAYSDESFTHFPTEHVSLKRFFHSGFSQPLFDWRNPLVAEASIGRVILGILISIGAVSAVWFLGSEFVVELLRGNLLESILKFIAYFVVILFVVRMFRGG